MLPWSLVPTSGHSWLIQLHPTYLKRQMNVLESVFFRVIYRDDGLVAFVGQQNKSEIQEWLWKYQSLVNKLAGGKYLQFTTKLWQPFPANKDNSPVWKDKKEKGVTVIHKGEFPFLDMKMGWDKKSREI
eukprot:15342379-Ditylum_brightwellii.AAC.1